MSFQLGQNMSMKITQTEDSNDTIYVNNKPLLVWDQVSEKYILNNDFFPSGLQTLQNIYSTQSTQMVDSYVSNNSSMNALFMNEDTSSEIDSVFGEN